MGQKEEREKKGEGGRGKEGKVEEERRRKKEGGHEKIWNEGGRESKMDC